MVEVSGQAGADDVLRETLYEVANGGGENPESRNCWIMGYPEGGFIEKYLSGNVCVAFRRVETSLAAFEQDGFVIQRAPSGLDLACVSFSDIAFRYKGINDDQSFMLSQNVQLMDGVEEWVPSFVSPRSFDCGSFAGSDPLFYFHHFDGFQKVCGGLFDGEMGVAIGFHAVAHQNGGHKQIKRGSSGVDDSPNIALNEGVERGSEISDKQLFVSAIRIELYDRLIWAAPLPGFESIFQDWDLGYGPVGCGLSV
jgi:hypothetical protein